MFVPIMVRRRYSGAAAPGKGTRLKIVEAMAMEVPVVSTTIGAEGLDVHDGEDILIADDAASFAQAVLRLLETLT